MKSVYKCRIWCRLCGQHTAIDSTIQGYVNPKLPPILASFVNSYRDCNGLISTDYTQKNFLNYKNFYLYLSQITLQYKKVNCEMRSHLNWIHSAIILLVYFNMWIIWRWPISAENVVSKFPIHIYIYSTSNGVYYIYNKQHYLCFA